ncbi:DUF6470 family protein [Syntrophomonas curvata]
MVHLQIHQQYARIGLNIKDPAIRLHTSHPRLEMKTRPGQLTMESPRPDLHIDQSKCFADAGLRSPEILRDYIASQALSDFMEGVGEVVSEGDALAQITGTSIADIAATCLDTNYVFDAKAIPQQRPDIRFDIYPVKIDYQPADADVRLRQGRVESNLERGKVEVYLRQKNYVEIRYAGENYNTVA